MIKKAAILLIVLLGFYSVNAQYSLDSWSGGQPQFNTYADMIGGKTESEQVTISIQRFSGANNVTQWRLTARLIQDYVNASNSAYSVGAEYSYLKFNSQTTGQSNTAISISTQPVQMSKYNEVTLIQSAVPLTGSVNRRFKFDLMIQGGNHLLVNPNGTYHSAYEFKLYRIANNTETLVATHTQSVGGSARFMVNYSGNFGSQSVTLQNGATNFNLQFNTVNDYATGKSVLIANGLNVATSNNYQLSIKASGNFMTSTTSTETIPVSVLKAELTTSQSVPGLQIFSPITLSASDQIIAVRSQYVASVNYNLRFFISPNSLSFGVAPGTYTTYVYFVIIPN